MRVLPFRERKGESGKFTFEDRELADDFFISITAVSATNESRVVAFLCFVPSRPRGYCGIRKANCANENERHAALAGRALYGELKIEMITGF